jgi:hypothetical protein
VKHSKRLRNRVKKSKVDCRGLKIDETGRSWPEESETGREGLKMSEIG